MSDSMNVFNRAAVGRHRDRAAANIAEHNFLLRDVAERLLDRLDDVTRDFPLAVELGCRGGELTELLAGRPDIGALVSSDLSPAFAALPQVRQHALSVTADEEFLPFGGGAADLAISNLALHWVNDLPGAFRQIRDMLKPDGLFLAALFGGETLKELRHALSKAEIELEGGLSARLSPVADVRDLGGLLMRAGFALPVADRDTVTVSYGDPFRLMTDLRGMGEANANRLRRTTFSRRATLMRAAEIYRDEFGDTDGRVPATFEIIFVTGWAPHESQQKPLTPGSASVRLADALDTEEVTLAAGPSPPRGDD